MEPEAGPSGETAAKAAQSQSSGQAPKGTKVRKAYTITKQRERWTDDEHERFLQALKRYGRAWRKIEEHIGTKTAVQIRSHAQKFFSKLQREQSNGDGSSEANGISIPPPRPKRKPMHPYPRKNGELPRAASQQRSEPASQQTPASTGGGGAAAAAAAGPAAALPSLEGREPTLAQVLEAAALAAATAWSRVVDSAGAKVQQQLQAHLSAQQSLQGLQPPQPLLAGLHPQQQQQPAVLQQLAAVQQQNQLAVNLQSSTQHSRGRGGLLGLAPEQLALAAASAPLLQAQSMQDSPDGAGATAGTGNDRDSACSKDHARRQPPATAAATATSRQGLQWTWPQNLIQPPQPDARLGRAWDLHAAHTSPAAAAASLGGSALALPSGSHPTRAFSAGPVLHMSSPAQPAAQASPAPAAAAAPTSKPEASGRTAAAGGSRSDTSQLAHFYQQAAQRPGGAQDPDPGENGSSGEGDGSSGDGSNDKMGLPRSDKGSNTGNSGSDEDANGNGSGSRSGDAGDLADANGTADGKGSDEGSNSPRGFTRNSTPSLPAGKPDAPPQPPPQQPAPAQQPQPQQRPAAKPPALFTLNGGADSARVAAAAVRLQHQQPQPPQQRPLPVAPQPQPQAGLLHPALSQQALLQQALQQQALSAWASMQQQAAAQHPAAAAAAATPGLSLLQGLLSGLQQAGGGQPQLGSQGPPGEMSSGGRKSSGAPSMDTFAAVPSTRSFSMPTALGAVSEGGAHAPEEASGFKPYNKRHGMPVASLPPSKRLAMPAALEPAAAAAARSPLPQLPPLQTGALPPPAALVQMAQPGIYSPFGSVAERNAARKP